MTPREFSEMEKRHRNRRREWWLAVGELGSAVVNSSMSRKRGSRPIKPADFMPRDLR